MEGISYLRRPIIAVTGSSGKTTTKEMIAAILARRWKIFKSPHNKNAFPATRKHAQLLQLSHRAAVLEYGMQYYGDIKRHCQYIQPNIGVITNVGRAHVGNFGGRIHGVAKAKSELIRYMKPTGILLLNADDSNSTLLQTKGFKGDVVRIGIHNKAEYRAYHISYAKKGMRFRVQLDGTLHHFFIPIFGLHHIYNALFAIAISHRLGLTPKQMQNGLITYDKQKGRMIVYDLGRGVRLVDDSYNANPETVKSALNVLSDIGTKSNIAVLGSMLELGRHSIKGHKEVGKYAASKNITAIFTYGRSAAQIAAGAQEAGFPPKNVHSFVSKYLLHKELIRVIQPDTTILVKGSNQMDMNTTVRYLKQFIKNKRSV